MRPAAPWTDIGAIQSEIHSLQSELSRKVNNYELSALHGRLDRLEHSVLEIRALFDGLQSRMQMLEETR